MVQNHPLIAQITGITQPQGYATFSGLFKSFEHSPNIIGLLLSRALVAAIIGAGLIFFVRLLSAGFIFLTSVGDPAKIQSATKTIVSSLVGLLIVITSYFIVQIIETIFGVKILI